MRHDAEMMRAAAILLSIVVVATPAIAASRPLVVTIEGRPISHGASIAVLRHGTAYANLTELVRSYNGIVTTTRGATTVTVRTHQATFVPGSRSVVLDTVAMPLDTPAYLASGSLYVPLVFFVRRVARGRVRVDAARATADISVGQGSLRQGRASR